ncbi:syndecan [Asbolus verrucosus]|uniref:Syndecan n=1 Tax=Asbolus verrucosus TaxID=1661398 RepID=A0A482V8V3_ASBVE|nr:syndecan [Asbolus verrucosus]
MTQAAGHRNSDITFTDDDTDIEGSGIGGEVSHDLESSGSGYGPDDEDTPVVNVPNVFNTEPPKKNEPVSDRGNTDIGKEPVVIPTEDTGVIMNPKSEDRHTSFFAQPGILAAVIGGAVVGLLCAILVVMFIVYRMRKKDEGSYALGEPKQSPTTTSYSRGNNKEFYA